MKTFLEYYIESVNKKIKDIESLFIDKIKPLQDDYAKCKEIVYMVAKTALENGVSNFKIVYGTVSPINPFDNEKGDPVEHYWIIENDKVIDYADKQFEDEELEYENKEEYNPSEFVEKEFKRSHTKENTK